MDDPVQFLGREILSSLEGRYDREVVRSYLRKYFKQTIREQDDVRGVTRDEAEINVRARRGAAEIEGLIWEHLDSALAMGIKSLIFATAAVYLPLLGRQLGVPEREIREWMEAKSEISDLIAKGMLDPWLERFSPLFSHAGRPLKGEDQKERESSEKEKELKTLRAALDEIVEVWAKKEDAPKMTIAILHREMDKRDHAMSFSTLKRRLSEIDENMKSINHHIEEKKRLK
jgi:hypothetical protein